MRFQNGQQLLFRARLHHCMGSKHHTRNCCSAAPLTHTHTHTRTRRNMGCALSRDDHQQSKRAKQYAVPSEAAPDDDKHATTKDSSAPTTTATQQQQPATAIIQADGTSEAAAASSLNALGDQPAAAPLATSQTPAAAAAAAAADNTPTTAKQAPTAKKLDPKDFMFTGLQGTTCVKLPGAVKGQQFIIDNCKDCDLFVLDHCASVTIDDCTNCRLFVGPTEASVFMRDCSNCTLATITRQLRCRDCSNCSVLLLTRTRPIIESCSSMCFGCYDAPYAGLAAQMAAAQLNPFHNFWSDVYDFTPRQARKPTAATPGGGAAALEQCQNWSLLPSGDSRSVLQFVLGHTELPVEVQQAFGIVSTPASGAAAGETAAGAAAAGETTGAAADATSLAAVELTFPDAASEPAANSQVRAAQQSEQALASSTPMQAAQAAEATPPMLPPPVATGAAAAAGGVAGVSDADRMAVIRTHGLRALPEQTNSSSSSSNCLLFILFPVGSHAAALHWVHSTFSPATAHHHQHHNQQQPGSSATGGQQTSGPAPLSTAAAAGDAYVLLHTNEAAIPGPVLPQMATAAGWTKQQLKALGCIQAAAGGAGSKRKSAAAAANRSDSCCVVGLEVSCGGDEGARQRLMQMAEGVGAVCSCDKAAVVPKLFRGLGVDG